MDIKTKCEIIEEFILNQSEIVAFSDDIEEFLELNDVGIPLAQSVSYNLASLTPEGEEMVEDTWMHMCALLAVDPNGEYEELNDMFY